MGTSDQLAEYYDFLKDHPHAYGDKLDTGREMLVQAGSSPRVWGQAATQSHFSDRARIIPTRMGTSYPHTWQG